MQNLVKQKGDSRKSLDRRRDNRPSFFKLRWHLTVDKVSIFIEYWNSGLFVLRFIDGTANLNTKELIKISLKQKKWVYGNTIKWVTYISCTHLKINIITIISNIRSFSEKKLRTNTVIYN